MAVSQASSFAPARGGRRDGASLAPRVESGVNWYPGCGALWGCVALVAVSFFLTWGQLGEEQVGEGGRSGKGVQQGQLTSAQEKGQPHPGPWLFFLPTCNLLRLVQGHRCEALHQGQRIEAQNQGHPPSWLSPFVMVAKSPPIITNKFLIPN